MHKRSQCHNEAAQPPVDHSCSLLNYLNSFHRGKFKLNTKFDADSLLYFLSHFECNGLNATLYMLTQWHLPPPLTSTVKSSLFTHAHSSLLSLAARLHGCRAFCYHYITNGWTLSRPHFIQLVKRGKSCYLWQHGWPWGAVHSVKRSDKYWLVSLTCGIF